MDLGLLNKVVIITGGARGIGRACVLSFAQERAKVVFTYSKSTTHKDTLEKELKSIGVEHLSLQLDVRNYESCKKVVEETLEKFGKIDILINNAGIIKDRALALMSLEDWGDVIDTNLNGTFNMTRAVITTMVKEKRGCIINISSVSGLVGISRQTNYCSSKFGIVGFTRALAKEVAHFNVRVNAVCPGYINTDMISAIPEQIKNNLIKTIPLKRLGEPYEVADCCLFLSSEKAKYITGAVMTIDGGLIC